MSSPADPGSRVERSAICLGCACLCDDIVVTLEDGKLVDADRACDLGRRWFHDAWLGLTPDQPAKLGGQPATMPDVIDALASILRSARAPVFSGLHNLTCEDQALALELAASIGAYVRGEDIGHHLAQSRAGSTTASWGEIRARADVVLFWGHDPLVAWPRLLERLIDKPGRFVGAGRPNRIVLAALPHRWHPILARCDAGLVYDCRRQAEILHTLRALVRGLSLADDRIATATGLGASGLRSWAEALLASRYAAIITADRCFQPSGQVAWEALYGLADDLNANGRCVLVPLAGRNAAGASSTLVRRLGTSTDADCGSACPTGHYDDQEARLNACDAFLYFHAGHITLDRQGRPPGRLVSIRTAQAGIDNPGTFLRGDELALRLPTLVTGSLPRAWDVIGAVLARLGDAGTTRP